MSARGPVKASPEGVPGAVSDPARVNGEDITFAGHEGTHVNGPAAKLWGRSCRSSRGI